MNHEIYIFGSVMRGEVSSTSDTDVLVIPLEGKTKKDYPPNWSYYTKEIIRRMHSEGRLFSWHLHLDAKCIFTPNETSFLNEIGEPNSYETAIKDIHELKYLLEQSVMNLRNNTQSKIYEIGIVHTCLRDIAMSASWCLKERPCFSVDAPYKIGIPLPMKIITYKKIVSARHNSTRGIIDNTIDWVLLAEEVLEAPIGKWISEVEENIHEFIS